MAPPRREDGDEQACEPARQPRGERCVACGKPTCVGEDFGGPCVHDSDLACALWQRDDALAALAEAENLLAQRGHWLVKVLDDRGRALDALMALVRELPKPDRAGNAPGHAHRTPGIWDDDPRLVDNAAFAGRPCRLCAAYAQAVAIVGEKP